MCLSCFISLFSIYHNQTLWDLHMCVCICLCTLQSVFPKRERIPLVLMAWHLVGAHKTFVE